MSKTKAFPSFFRFNMLMEFENCSMINLNKTRSRHKPLQIIWGISIYIHTTTQYESYIRIFKSSSNNNEESYNITKQSKINNGKKTKSRGKRDALILWYKQVRQLRYNTTIPKTLVLAGLSECLPFLAWSAACSFMFLFFSWKPPQMARFADILHTTY